MPLCDVFMLKWPVIKSGIINNTAYIIKLLNRTDRLALVKVVFLNRSKSIIGCFVRAPA